MTAAATAATAAAVAAAAATAVVVAAQKNRYHRVGEVCKTTNSVALIAQ